jgi:hypothetical protein
MGDALGEPLGDGSRTMQKARDGVTFGENR